MLIPRMLDDAFRLTVDPLFYGSVSNGKFPVDGYADKENMWLNLNIDKWSWSFMEIDANKSIRN